MPYSSGVSRLSRRQLSMVAPVALRKSCERWLETRDECSNGSVFTAWAEAPEASRWRYIMLAMDRQNFAGIPTPNWTCGAIYFFIV